MPSSPAASGQPGAQGLPSGSDLPGVTPAGSRDSSSGSVAGNASQNGAAGNNDGAGAPGTFGNGTQDATGGGDLGNGGVATTGAGTGSSDDPFADLANGRNTTMSTAERRAALDARLEQSYAVFDGMILSERANSQGETGRAGAGGMGGMGDGTGEGDDSAATTVAVASTTPNSSGAGYMPAGTNSREGDFDNSNQALYPVPEDIPNGNDDDVVARQLREAAISEADPELREKLWDEYRAYTGLSQ